MTKDNQIRKAGNIIYKSYLGGGTESYYIAALRLYQEGFRWQQTGTWSAELDEDEPNPMFKHVVCSACKGKSNTTHKFCPCCGARMVEE